MQIFPPADGNQWKELWLPFLGKYVTSAVNLTSD